MPRTRRLLLGLIGSGIRTSRTPAMHEREARAQGIHCLYQRIDLAMGEQTEADLPALLSSAEQMGFAGLNITHPCKQCVMAHLTELSDDARALGAINTIVFRDRRRVGHNTDWWAFRESLRHGLPDASLRHVVQLGAGGAGAATAYATLKAGAERLDIVDIVQARSDALAARLNESFPGRVFARSSASEALLDADGLIHATPTGMTAHPGLPLAADLLDSRLWVAEVVYFPLETELIREARARGCRTIDGSGMAVWQAVEAFRLFTGLEADAGRMRSFFDEAVE